jgi:predicted GNAT superfamily acetyltransferase
MAISIHPVTTVEECRIIEQLQIDIWGCRELEVAPDHFVLTMAKEGGVVLLARDEADRPIGFAYGFIGLTEDNRFKLASHQVGVLPAYQDRGLGYQLKLAQREATLARDLDLITWTFDPLQGRNARFNLRKLGVVCNTYLCDLYGSMRDELNQGLPSDRLKVDWWLATDYVIQRLTNPTTEVWPPDLVCSIINEVTFLENGLPVPPDTFDLPGTDFCLVEIPTDIQHLKTEALELAIKWRLHTRQVFEVLFDRGYTAIDLLRREGRNYYLLQKDWLPI